MKNEKFLTGAPKGYQFILSERKSSIYDSIYGTKKKAFLLKLKPMFLSGPWFAKTGTFIIDVDAPTNARFAFAEDAYREYLQKEADSLVGRYDRAMVKRKFTGKV